MTIQLQQVIPIYFEGEKGKDSHIWNQFLQFQSGQNIHIVAPSGSGKTSLIHFLYGLRNDYHGSIEYDSQSIKNFNAEKFASWRQQHVSVVFQDLRLFPDQTVWQNINIKRVLSPFHQESKIEAMAQRLGIANKLQQLCSTCSYGEQQRIAIIRSLQQPFSFLMLDEPFSHLDEKNREIAMDLMQEEAAARKASIILADLKPIDFFQRQETYYL